MSNDCCSNKEHEDFFCDSFSYDRYVLPICMLDYNYINGISKLNDINNLFSQCVATLDQPHQPSYTIRSANALLVSTKVGM